MATYRITNGTAAGAHEVYFDGKPSEAVREALKGLKMRWNHKKVCWYGFNVEDFRDKLARGASLDDMFTAAEDLEQSGGIYFDGTVGF